MTACEADGTVERVEPDKAGMLAAFNSFGSGLREIETMSKALTLDGQTMNGQALLRSVETGDAPRVTALLSAGANVDAMHANGETALMRAAAKGYADIVQILLDKGADVNSRREDGFTPLIVAAFFGHEEVVRALLAKGANTHARTRLGTTAEKWASSRGLSTIVEMLKEAARAQSPSIEQSGLSTRAVNVLDERMPDGIAKVKVKEHAGAGGPKDFGKEAEEVLVRLVASSGSQVKADDTALTDDKDVYDDKVVEREETETTFVSSQTVSSASSASASLVSESSTAARFRKSILSRPSAILSAAIILASFALVYAVWRGGTASPAERRQASAPPVKENAPQPVVPQLTPTPDGAALQGVAPVVPEQNPQGVPPAEYAPVAPPVATVPVDTYARASGGRTRSTDGGVSPELTTAGEDDARTTAVDARAQTPGAAAREKQPVDSQSDNGGAGQQPADTRQESLRRAQAPNVGARIVSPSQPSSPPIYTPAPSSTPARKKVIQWP